MNTPTPVARVLAIDDEPFDLMLIERYLSRAGYQVVRAGGGEQAWRSLHEPGYELPQVILLDRQMPGMDGMEFLAQLMADPTLRDIPVIMQTGLADPDQVAYGIARGARYYIAKPFTGELLVAMVRAAVQDYEHVRNLRDAAVQFKAGRWHLRSAQFELRTIEEAHGLATHLARYYPRPERVISGIVEILINAIEHGNLGLSYADKSALLRSDGWHAEVARRLALPEYCDKLVRADLRLMTDGIVLTVADEGAGFDWTPFLEIQPERAFDLHGRGIAMSRLMSFDRVDYRGRGNEVELTVLIEAEAEEDRAAPLADLIRDAA